MLAGDAPSALFAVDGTCAHGDVPNSGHAGDSEEERIDIDEFMEAVQEVEAEAAEEAAKAAAADDAARVQPAAPSMPTPAIAPTISATCATWSASCPSRSSASRSPRAPAAWLRRAVTPLPLAPSAAMGAWTSDEVD